MSTIKWRALLGLTLMIVASYFEIFWLWGLILLFWIVPDLRSGNTHLFEPVTRAANPIVYWLICSVWLVLAFVLLTWNILPYGAI